MKCSVLYFSLTVRFVLGLTPEYAAAKENATITITVDPPWDLGGPDRMDLISGTVTGSCKKCKIVLYSHGNVWYVQPYVDQTKTALRRDRTWSNRIHLGTEYAALLTKASYVPPAPCCLQAARS